MTPREYRKYSEELRANGYQYKENCPYEGCNLWLKEFPDDCAHIEMNVYRNIGLDGEEFVNINPRAIVQLKDVECEGKLILRFRTTNIIDVESMFDKYLRRLKD